MSTKVQRPSEVETTPKGNQKVMNEVNGDETTRPTFRRISRNAIAGFVDGDDEVRYERAIESVQAACRVAYERGQKDPAAPTLDQAEIGRLVEQVASQTLADFRPAPARAWPLHSMRSASEEHPRVDIHASADWLVAEGHGGWYRALGPSSDTPFGALAKALARPTPSTIFDECGVACAGVETEAAGEDSFSKGVREGARRCLRHIAHVRTRLLNEARTDAGDDAPRREAAPPTARLSGWTCPSCRAHVERGVQHTCAVAPEAAAMARQAHTRLVLAAQAVVDNARDQGRDDCMDDLVDEQFVEGLRMALEAVPATAEAIPVAPLNPVEVLELHQAARAYASIAKQRNADVAGKVIPLLEIPPEIEEEGNACKADLERASQWFAPGGEMGWCEELAEAFAEVRREERALIGSPLDDSVLREAILRLPMPPIAAINAVANAFRGSTAYLHTPDGRCVKVGLLNDDDADDDAPAEEEIPCVESAATAAAGTSAEPATATRGETSSAAPLVPSTSAPALRAVAERRTGSASDDERAHDWLDKLGFVDPETLSPVLYTRQSLAALLADVRRESFCEGHEKGLSDQADHFVDVNEKLRELAECVSILIQANDEKSVWGTRPDIAWRNVRAAHKATLSVPVAPGGDRG